MAEFPFLPIWTDAYLADTRHLSTEQHGAYLLPLMEAWRRPSCSLPDDDALLARLSGLGGQWAGSRDVIMAFWSRDGRRKEWTQKRPVQERGRVASKSRSQRDKAAKRWKEKTKADAVAMPEDMPNACPADTSITITRVIEDTNVSSLSEPAVADVVPHREKKARSRNPYTPEYETFWASYPSTMGMSKLDGFKAWQKLTPEQQAQAPASLPAYKAHLQSESWRKVKHVQGYLNSRRFETMRAAVTELETSVQWQKRLGHARARREWYPAKWGPAPGADGCRVPAELLRPDAGEGWQEARAA